MERNLDPRLLRAIENSTSLSNNQDQCSGIFEYAPLEQQPGFSFARPRQALSEPLSYSDYTTQTSYDPHSAALHPAGTGVSRLSLGPSNKSRQSEGEPRVITNADNYFRFTQNLRQGAPVTYPPARQTPAQFDQHANSKDTIDQLANSMLLQRLVPQSKSQAELSSPLLFSGYQPSKATQFQPQKQQVTPPFNMSGFVYSPTAQNISEHSSPPTGHGQGSSPSARVSLRRAINRQTPTTTCHHAESIYKEPPSQVPATPQRQIAYDHAGQNAQQTIALSHAPPIANGIQLVSPHELPDRFRQVFPYQLFNAAQSKCFAPIYKTNDNVVVSAPTGSGKTALLELAICKLVESHASGQFKIVYQAPTKSLCSERMRDWSKKFCHLNLPCAELTGDTTQAEMTRVRDASIIVTTPEKWDSITRKWTDHHKLVQMVKLFLIDEVHILKDGRGATLEAVVSRMKTVGGNVRFVALSATVPNSEDVATWLGRDHNNKGIPAHRETFGEDFRPVKLVKHVVGFEGTMNDFAFEKVLDGKLPSLIQKYTHKKPIMVFGFTRKSCETTAHLLAEWWTRQRVIDRAWPAPMNRTTVNSKELRELVGCGVAFHHAGLDPQDRHAVERGFLRGEINVICCTSTLAVGINLPCHMVVLKGTVGYQDGGMLSEYSDLEVMQMLGRAGRPQFDDNSVAIIMTRADKTHRYQKMISGQDILESTLHLNLIEHLNSEISLGTIKNLYLAKTWLSGTFLSVRMRQNPKYYNIDGVTPGSNADQRQEQVCERDIRLLQESNLVTGEDTEQDFSCTEYGEAMSRYMVQFETMKLLMSIPSKAKTEQILNIICQAIEFKDLRMKPAERPWLREFNKSPFIKFPVHEPVTTAAHKMSLMIQVQLGGIELPTEKEFTNISRQFRTETGIIFERIQRLIRCVIDCKSVECDAISTRHALDLARSLSAQFWDYSNLQLRQIPGFGPVAVRKLVSGNINSIEKLMSIETSTIERAMSKNPPHGQKIKDILVGFPRLRLTGQAEGQIKVKNGQMPRVKFKVQLSYDNKNLPIWKSRKPSLTFIAETTNGTLVHIWRGNIIKLQNSGFYITFSAELSGPDDEIRCLIACAEIVGTAKFCTIKHNIPASAFPGGETTSAAFSDPNAKQPIKAIRFGQDEYDEFDGDGLGDEDMLAVVQSVEAAESNYGSDDFADIEDFEGRKELTEGDKTRQEEELEPVRMANGKWSCNHVCCDNQLLKNGQACKHKCCHEGLEKPRKLKRKLSLREDQNQGQAKKFKFEDEKDTTKFQKKRLGPESSSTRKNEKTKASKQSSSPTLKNYYGELDLEDVKIIDLSQDPPFVSHTTTASREYRKLHSLHTSVQEDKTTRLTNQKPQFSYPGGEEPELDFFEKHQEQNKDILDDEADFPPLSDLSAANAGIQSEGDDPFESDRLVYQGYPGEVPISSLPRDSLDSLEAGTPELHDSVVVRNATPKVESSFANGVFDFSAFPDDPILREYCSEPVTEEGEDIVELSEDVMKDCLKEQDVTLGQTTKADAEQTVLHQPSVPAWVSEFDADLIDGLKDFVDFID